MTGQLIGATDMNAYVRDNPNYLLSGWPIAKVIREGVSNYSLTNTAFADVDAVNLILTLILASTRALIWVCLSATGVTAVPMEFDVIANSTTRYGATNGAYAAVGGSGGYVGPSISFFAHFTGLTPGSNTFKLQSRTQSAGTYTISNNAIPISMLGWGF